MEISIFLAKMWGLFTVVVCTGLLLRNYNLKKLISGLENEVMILYSAILALLIGIPSILAHNIWSKDWRVIVTFLGWAAFAKGLALLFFPKSMITFATNMNSGLIYKIALVIYLLLGLYLLFVGFFA